MEHIIVYKDEGAYSCFPGLARRRNGELWLVFRRAGAFSVQAVRLGKYDHVDQGARIAYSRSFDDGRTWTPITILPPSDPECGEQDCSITELHDGTLLINFFRWRVVPEQEKHRLPFPAYHLYDGSWADVEGPWVIRSRDDGRSWEPPARVDSSPLPRAGTADAVLELPDGTLLMGIYGAHYPSRVCTSYVVRSTDGGQTWGNAGLIARDPEERISFEEPALALTPAGHLIAVLRAGEPRNYQYLYRAFSYDGGRTWTELEPTPMWGHPAHVLPLADGRLLCTYGYRRPPFGVRACLSEDNGRTWDIEHEIILRDDGASRDIGYPSSVQLPDGTILTAYYIHGEDLIRHIAVTRWVAP